MEKKRTENPYENPISDTKKIPKSPPVSAPRKKSPPENPHPSWRTFYTKVQTPTEDSALPEEGESVGERGGWWERTKSARACARRAKMRICEAESRDSAVWSSIDRKILLFSNKVHFSD